MAFSYYIYYRVDPGKADECESVIHQVLEEVKRTTGIAGKLLRKRDEPLLWMEIYENVADDAKFEWELADIADRLNVKQCLVADTTRHVECFEH